VDLEDTPVPLPDHWPSDADAANGATAGIAGSKADGRPVTVVGKEEGDIGGFTASPPQTTKGAGTDRQDDNESEKGQTPHRELLHSTDGRG
jgi:hypothetical protein